MSVTTFLQKSLYKFIAKGATPVHRPAPLGRQAQTHIPSWGFAYYLEQEVSIFSDIVLTLKQEMFRRGFTWEPLFTYKCQDCGTIYQDEIEECECGSTNLIEPDKSQMSLFERGEHTYIRTANANGQSLQEVLTDFEFNMDVCDNAYMILLKAYVYSNSGEILESEIREIISVDPRGLKKIADENGRIGNQIWICPEHRNVTENESGHTCRQCKNKLLPAYYETTGTSDKQYYLNDEVIHSSKFYPSILYGYPPILKAVDTALAYHYLEKRTLSFYERGRAPGIATFPTNNQASLRAFWDETMERLQDDPYYIPIVGYDSGGKAGAAFLKLMEDPNTDMLEVKKELRERIGSRFGVSLIFQGDTSTSGGLNNEGLQITVTNRAIEDGQRIYNEKVLPWLCSQFGITDFVLQLNPNEEADEMADKERLAKDISNARGMWEMGFDVDYDGEEFEFSGEAKPRDEGGDAGGFPTFPDIQASLIKKECPPGQHRHSSHDYCHPETRVHGGGVGDSSGGVLSEYKNELGSMDSETLSEQIGIIEEEHPEVGEQLGGWYTGNDMATFDEKITQIFNMDEETSRSDDFSNPVTEDEKEGYTKIYLATQEYLKRTGDDSLILQRGLHSRSYEKYKHLEPGEDIELNQYNVSSWSNDYDMAIDFAQGDPDGGVVVETMIPIERVFMHPDLHSKIVDHGEGEHVVMGSKIESVMAEIYHPNGEDS